MAKHTDLKNVINYNGLTDKEQYGITFFVNRGYREGNIDGLQWSIELDEKDAFEVVDMLDRGFTSGFYPDWRLSFTRKNKLDAEIEERIKDYCVENKIELNDEEFRNTCGGVRYWLDVTIPDAISDSVTSAKEITKGN